MPFAMDAMLSPQLPWNCLLNVDDRCTCLLKLTSIFDDICFMFEPAVYRYGIHLSFVLFPSSDSLYVCRSCPPVKC